MLLDTIKGYGKDTFNTIIENMNRTYYIGGDSYANIIRDDEGVIVNLKPLPPEAMEHVANRQGIIIKYRQKSKVKMPDKTFMPEDILHLTRNRVADEIHGVSLIEALETIILMRNEAMADYKLVMHRNVAPVRIWHLDTDDTSKINAFITKINNMVKNTEHIVIPKGMVEVEQASVAPNSTLNPLPWIQWKISARHRKETLNPICQPLCSMRTKP